MSLRSASHWAAGRHATWASPVKRAARRLRSASRASASQPTQCRTPRRGVGLAGAARRRAAAFAFGAPQGWQRFALFVLASDGALFALCPVAPFGMALPRGAAAALLAEARGAGGCATTEAWLQQARPPAPPRRLLLPSARAAPPCRSHEHSPSP